MNHQSTPDAGATPTVRHRPWPVDERAAPLPVAAEAARGIAVTDRMLRRDGVPFVPVSGELHFSRVPRERWAERLRQMRAGGITVVATYVLWLHHVPERGRARFDGDLDVAAFIDEAEAAGLEVALRIGPWAHGEARNGGYPDWVQAADVAHRSDDPAYLELVREWFAQLAAALDGRAAPGGPVIAVQLENELYDRPEHIATLRGLARDAGIAAPLWTATAWGGAELPDGVVFPLFGGYSDGFWADPDADWDPSFRAHFFFSHEWDDPGVGADVRASQGFAAAGAVTAGEASTPFPPATCELGGGMATAYHRRPVPHALDIATVAHIKVGNGSAWQGYYMYAGGRNPAPGLHESIATGYPNDITPLGYDFHAPLGTAGDTRDSHRLLRLQHAFLSAFGHRLAEMRSSLPDDLPHGLDDRDTLRWALRSDGASGFVFVSRHQPRVQLPDAPPTSLRVELDTETIELPAVPIPAGTLARWPVHLDVGGVHVRWATASALTVLAGAVPTLVLMAEAGVPALVSVGGAASGADADVIEIAPADAPTRVTTDAGALDILVLPTDAPIWVRESGAHRELLRSNADLEWDDHELRARSVEDAPRVERYEPAAGRFAPLDLAPRGVPATSAPVVAEPVASAGAVPDDYGFGGPRHRAPSPARLDASAAVWRLDLPDWAHDHQHDALLEIDWAGDVGELRVDGVPVDDRYFDGARWRIAVRDLDLTSASIVTLHVLPLSARSTVWLPPAADARRRGDDGALLALDAVTVTSRGPWRTASLPLSIGTP